MSSSEKEQVSINDVIKYLRENVSIRVETRSGRDYQYAGEGLTPYTNIRISLVIINEENKE